MTADKYWNLQLPAEKCLDGCTVTNIAAFQLNEDTSKYLLDVSAALMLPWFYIPAEKQLEAYGAAIKKLGPQCWELYKRAASSKIQKQLKEVENCLKAADSPSYRHVLLYGKGYRGKIFCRLCKELGIKVSGFVVSDGYNKACTEFQNMAEDEISVYEYSSIPFNKEELLIIQTAFSEEITQRLTGSDYHVLNFSEQLWNAVQLWDKYSNLSSQEVSKESIVSMALI